MAKLTLTFLGLAEKVIREEQRPLSPAEMWKIATAKGYDRLVDFKTNSPQKSLHTCVYCDTRDHPSTIFMKVGQRPARYFLKELHDTSKKPEIDKATTAPDDVVGDVYDYKEADLHPFLAYFAHLSFNACTKTIKHSKSKRKEFGEWVHPDMIGVYYPVQDWSSEVLALSDATGNTAVKLYSFEIKKTLSFSNLREAFFQAVSNSSWANEAYLVAAEISADEDFASELRRLSASFGIGVIRLVLDDPDSSEVLLSGRERDNIDWDTLNKLTMNKDVQELLRRIKNDLTTREIIRSEYDRVLAPDELIKSVKKRSK